VNDAGQKYGVSTTDVHDLLISAGFDRFTYEPFARHLSGWDEEPGRRSENAIYIRDLEWLKERIRDAPNRTICGQALGYNPAFRMVKINA